MLNVIRNGDQATLVVEGDVFAYEKLNPHELRARAREMLAVAEQIEPELPTREQINEVLVHLDCALVQSIPSDDQIIVNHIRDAYHILGGKNR